MNNKITILLLTTLSFFITSAFTLDVPQQKSKKKPKTTKQVIKKTKEKAVVDTTKQKLKLEIAPLDSLLVTNKKEILKVYKKDAHASYYHDKFNGRRTASGKTFDNSKYTAAHKKLPFGTKVKVTNEANGKSVIVEINDRGPFSRAREIDLSKKAFMDIASNKNSGVVIVTIEIIE
jgi:rare lipoprotein A